jgi:hypothetical protein
VLRLTAGFHHIEIVSFFTWGYVKHGNGGSSLRAYWEGPGIPKQIIPAGILFQQKTMQNEILAQQFHRQQGMGGSMEDVWKEPDVLTQAQIGGKGVEVATSIAVASTEDANKIGAAVMKAEEDSGSGGLAAVFQEEALVVGAEITPTIKAEPPVISAIKPKTAQAKHEATSSPSGKEEKAKSKPKPKPEPKKVKKGVQGAEGLKGTFVSIENMEDPSVFKARKLFVDPKGAQTKTVANVDFPMKKYMIDDVKLTNDNFAARFKGYIHVKKGGKYTFYTHSDDGSALYIDSKLVVDNNGIHGPESRKGVLRLTAGFHHIEIVSFFTWGYVQHGNGGSSLRAYWEGPGIPKQIIPADLLWTEHEEVVSTESEDTPDGALSLLQIGATMREIKNDDHFNVKELDACKCAMYCAEHTECHGFTFSGNEETGRMCQLKGSDAELSEDADCATCQSALMPKGDAAAAVEELLAADEGEETPKQLIVDKARDGSLSEALLGTWSEEDNAWATNMLHGLGRQVSMEQLKQLV